MATHRQSRTPHSTASESLHDDWKMTRAWRRMFLALVDTNTVQARAAVHAAARMFAGLAATYAADHSQTAVAIEAAAEVPSCSACSYKAISSALSALRAAQPTVEGDLCEFLRTEHPAAPPTFAKVGANTVNRRSSYVPTQHRIVPP